MNSRESFHEVFGVKSLILSHEFGPFPVLEARSYGSHTKKAKIKKTRRKVKKQHNKVQKTKKKLEKKVRFKNQYE